MPASQLLDAVLFWHLVNNTTGSLYLLCSNFRTPNTLSKTATKPIEKFAMKIKHVMLSRCDKFKVVQHMKSGVSLHKAMDNFSIDVTAVLGISKSNYKFQNYVANTAIKTYKILFLHIPATNLTLSILMFDIIQ